MKLKNISFSDPCKNILFDDVLLSLAEEQKASETLRLWESRKLFIVLGKTSKIDEDVYGDVVRKNDIPILRRSSGGGTVLQGKGCLNFSLILSKDEHPELLVIRKSYQFILKKIIKALKSLEIQAVWHPISDIAIKGSNKKISGNAQRRAKNFVLHHGTILYDFNLKNIEKYLKIPKSCPSYRDGRDHEEFVENISKTSENIKSAIANQFPISSVEDSMSLDERKCLEGLMASRQ